MSAPDTVASFAVDDVALAEEALPTMSLAERYGEVLAVEGEDVALVDHGSTHAFLGAIHLAFAEHRVLELSPDAVWLTIARGFAHHVRRSPGSLRGRLVPRSRTGEVEEIRVQWSQPTMPRDAASWRQLVGGFRAGLAERVGEGPVRLLECDFSTTTSVERVASQITLMDTYAPFFDYAVTCVCGIPEIRLLGTTEDWRKIRDRLDVFAEFDLSRWMASLKPILDQFVDASAGRVDRAFWQRIYKPVDAYAEQVATGWAARFYPYLREGDDNPLLAHPLGKLPPSKGDGTWYVGPGIRPTSIDGGPSAARVRVTELDGTENRVALEAHLHVQQRADGALRPATAWSVREATDMRDVIVALNSDARVEVQRATERVFDGVAEYAELFSSFGELTFRGECEPVILSKMPLSKGHSSKATSPYVRVPSEPRTSLRPIGVVGGSLIALAHDMRFRQTEPLVVIVALDSFGGESTASRWTFWRRPNRNQLKTFRGDYEALPVYAMRLSTFLQRLLAEGKMPEPMGSISTLLEAVPTVGGIRWRGQRVEFV